YDGNFPIGFGMLPCHSRACAADALSTDSAAILDRNSFFIFGETHVQFPFGLSSMQRSPLRKTSGNMSTSPIVIFPFKCAIGVSGGFAVMRQKLKCFCSFKLYGFHKVNLMPLHVTPFQAMKIVSFPLRVCCPCYQEQRRDTG